MPWDDVASMEVDSPLLGFGTPDRFEANLPLNISSLALEASRVVKSGPGRLYGFTVTNTSASAQYIQVFDASTLPADGSIPNELFRVSAGVSFPVQWIPWRTFNVGCVICNSSTAATKTIGSADCFFAVQFL